MMSDYWLAIDSKSGAIVNAVYGDGERIPQPKIQLEDCEWKPREQVGQSNIAEYEQRNGF